MAKIRLGKIKYINIEPIYNRFLKTMDREHITLVNDSPFGLNYKMEHDALDISPVSSYSYGKNYKKWILIPDLSISCNKHAMSVILVSRYPLNQLNRRTVGLTSDSETSIALLKTIFASENVAPVFKKVDIQKNHLKNHAFDGLLIIGDAAIKHNWQNKYKYKWDLGMLWNIKWKLPFVFAVWAIRKEFAAKHPELTSRTVSHLLASKRYGLNHLSEISKEVSKAKYFSESFCNTYFRALNYDLTESHISGLNRFFSELKSNKLITSNPALNFFRNPSQNRAA